jgi:hypothetical protein
MLLCLLPLAAAQIHRRMLFLIATMYLKPHLAEIR